MFLCISNQCGDHKHYIPWRWTTELRNVSAWKISLFPNDNETSFHLSLTFVQNYGTLSGLQLHHSSTD